MNLFKCRLNLFDFIVLLFSNNNKNFDNTDQFFLSKYLQIINYSDYADDSFELLSNKNFMLHSFEVTSSSLLFKMFDKKDKSSHLLSNLLQFDVQLRYKYHSIFLNKNNKFSGLFFLFKFINNFYISFFLLSSTIYWLLYLKIIIINKILFSWLVLTVFVYLLLSGFVFFSKKYRFGKFTTSIQRFWKRTFILFWLIESSVFVVFFYLTFNASEEIFYMYDQIKFFKTHFFSWRLFISKLLWITILVLNSYYLIFNIRWNTFYKNSLMILINSFILMYILWVEFYQLYHISSFYSNINWYYDYDEFMWFLEYDFKKTRLVNNYMALCLFAKFWHMLFIFGFWVFFILRSNESNSIKFLFLTCNYQNFIILYILSWLYMYPWLKFIIRNFLDVSYYWFLNNCNELFFKIFFKDFVDFYKFNKIWSFYGDKKIIEYNFYYLLGFTDSTSSIHCKTNIVKDIILNSLV